MKKNYLRFLLAAVVFCFFAPLAACAAKYDFYVDKNSTNAVEEGSEQFPFKTISAALRHIQSHNLKKKTIFVKKGTYAESLNIFSQVRLVGESRDETVIDADGFQNAVNFLSVKSRIENFTVKNARGTNIIVDKKSQVTIKNCKIKKAGNFGIEVKESSAASRYQFILENSVVSENSAQGVYISQRKISLSNNEIFSNGEEGVDLHQGVRGIVSGNDIYKNAESGIESILAGAHLTFKKNKVENNQAQGITVQVYSAKKKGKVKILKNTIKGNDAYGIRLANYTQSLGGRSFKIWVGKIVEISQNRLSENGKGEIFYE